MSQWTHVIGIIKYDYWAQNCWSSDSKRKDGKPECYNPSEKVKFLKKLYNKNKPEGSEGPIEIMVINSNRGPIVNISGDLRDFGTQNVGEITEWLNNVAISIEEYNKNQDFDNQLTIRDCIISCDVEYYEKLIIIFPKEKSWELMEINRPCKEDL